MGKLVLYLPDGTTRVVLLNKERITIGRRVDNDIALPYPAVSAEHAAVVTVLDDSFLEDLGSTNGTFINDKSVTKHFLRDRDRLDIGREVLVYYADDNAESEPLPPELLEHDRGSILEPLDAQLSALSDLTRDRATRHARGTESRPVVAEFDPMSTGPMMGQIATEFDSVSGGVDETERTRPVRARSAEAAPVPEIPSAPSETQAPSVVAHSAMSVYFVRVVNGPSAGREVEFAKNELLLGRVGVQVVALRKEGGEIQLVPIEGASLPLRNGTQVPSEGIVIHPGDMFEVAGTTLSLVRL